MVYFFFIKGKCIVWIFHFSFCLFLFFYNHISGCNWLPYYLYSCVGFCFVFENYCKDNPQEVEIVLTYLSVNLALNHGYY